MIKRRYIRVIFFALFVSNWVRCYVRFRIGSAVVQFRILSSVLFDFGLGLLFCSVSDWVCCCLVSDSICCYIQFRIGSIVLFGFGLGLLLFDFGFYLLFCLVSN